MPVWGSVQVGSAARFSSKGKPADDGYAPDLTNVKLESPPPPKEYSGLQYGPDFEIKYEANQATPIDASMDLPRTLSPFMIQVEPPLIVGSNPAPAQGKKDYAGILGAAHRNAPSAWRAARNKFMQDIPGGERVSTGGSVEDFVSANGARTRSAGGNQVRPVTINQDQGGPGRIGTPALADLYTAVDIITQLRALVRTPPLVLLINPQSLSMSYTKIQQFSDRTRHGFVFQAWGEEQPKLSVSARCGAFISGGRGVNFASRLDSAAWQNVQTMFHFYRHNGYIYDTVGRSNANHMVGALSIHYDGWVYYGNMETFTYTIDEEGQLGGITFEMEFTINAMVDTSRQSLVIGPMRSPIPSRSDPRYQGTESKALPGNGDAVVSFSRDAGGIGINVEQGGSNFDYRPSERSPDGQPISQVTTVPSGMVSPKGIGGFVVATPATEITASVQRLPTPFGAGR